MLFFILFFFCLIYLTEVNGKNVNINAIAIAYGDEDRSYSNIINDFNKYSKENNLNITLHLNLLTSSNSSYSNLNYGMMIENLLKRKSNKYDIYIYGNTHSNKYGPYLLDLKKTELKEAITMYSSDILRHSCIYKNKLIGFPLSLDFNILYSNDYLLDKYHKPIPETWEELTKTAQYILNEEKNKTNNELIGYNGFFNDEEDYMMESVYEYIYSFRESMNSTFPKLTSKTAIKALKMLKEMKNQISSDDYFQEGRDDTLKNLMNGKGIFIKFLMLPDPIYKKINYTMSLIPGYKKGISGSTVGGDNIGIIDNYTEKNMERKNAAIKALEYIISKKVHKKYFTNRLLVTAIDSLYDDEEVCSKAHCKLIKSIQSITVNTYNYDYDKYSEYFKHYMKKFLYEGETAEKTLKNIEDITKIYYLSVNKKDSIVGFVCFIIIINIIIIMLLSITFLFIYDFKPFFEFMGIDCWILVILGSIFILSISFSKFGQLTSLKCHLNILFLCLGSSCIILPILYKLIIRFPDENKISFYIGRHKYLFFAVFLSIDLLLNELLYINPYKLKTFDIKDGENFQICKMKSSGGKFILMLMLVYKILVIATLLLFIFIEWNYYKVRKDVKFALSAIYVDALSVLLYLIIHFFTINNYIFYSIIRICIVIIGGLSNYLILFGYRIVIGLKRKQNLKERFINNISKDFVNDIDHSKVQSTYISGYYKNNYNDKDNQDINNNTRSIASASRSIISKIINYHYINGNEDCLETSVTRSSRYQ